LADAHSFFGASHVGAMRVWDVPPAILCRQHLLGEHRELHGLWNILTQGKTGYSRHPETLRWVGRTKALWNRHEALVVEMAKRGYNHYSPLDVKLASGQAENERRINTVDEQMKLLIAKPCECPLIQ
jgi:hypothetical protein